jgi:hypothetical protein
MRIPLRLGLALALTSLSLLTASSPIFKPLNLNGLEGQEVALYYLEIQGKEGELYHARLSFSGEDVYILSHGNFDPGDVVSFHGVARRGILVNQEYHRHPHPATVYYLSALGLGVFLLLFFRKWRFSLQEKRFREV